MTAEEFFENDILDLKQYPVENNEFLTRQGDAIIDISVFEGEAKDVVKEFVKQKIFGPGKYIYRKKSLYIPLRHLSTFLAVSGRVVRNIDEMKEEDFRESYILFLECRNICVGQRQKSSGKIQYSVNVIIINTLLNFKTSMKDSGKTIWEKDVWDVRELPLSPVRIDEAGGVWNISFKNIRNEHNKEIIKGYAKNLVLNKDYHVSTIKNIINTITGWSNFAGICVEDLKAEDVKKYCDYIDSKGVKNEVYNSRLHKMIEFYQYLTARGIAEINYFASSATFKKVRRKFKKSTISPYVMRQIYLVLPQINEELRCIFLINHCTGMRIHSICTLKLDCLYTGVRRLNAKEPPKKAYYITDYSSKQEKFEETPIPAELYDILSDRIAFLKETEEDPKYLFKASKLKNAPYRATKAREDLQKAFKDLGIVNEDGTPFVYHPHDNRHTYATDMVELDIPFFTIQQMLHHASPEMTLHYAEVNSKRSYELEQKFVTGQGEKIVFKDDIELGDIAEINWLRKNINAQALPNGFCGLPVKMGDCESGNECLFCGKFRTDKTYLEIHKSQLATTEHLIIEAEKNGWDIQLKTNKRIAERLRIIIKAIEEGE